MLSLQQQMALPHLAPFLTQAAMGHLIQATMHLATLE